MKYTIVFGYFYLITFFHLAPAAISEAIFMQDSVGTKNGAAHQPVPRVSVITTGNSVVVLVLASGDHAGLASYSCPKK